MSKQIEQQNQNNILECIEQAGEISRAGVAKQLGLSRTTVSSAVARLLEAGLVCEADQADPSQSRGRPGIPLALTTDIWYAAGAALIDSEMLFVLTDLRGHIVDRLAVPVPDGTSDAFLRALSDGFQTIIVRCPGRLLPMLGVGSPGMINHGRILWASDMGWENIPISDHLMDTLGLPSTVVNRHWASCLSEYHFGVGKGIQSLIYVGISTGIAASIILDGKLFTGAYHNAGEIGHTVVNRNGPRCSCGRRGCLHAIASELALRKHVSEYYIAHPGPAAVPDPLWATVQAGDQPDIHSICRAAAAGHPVALSELQTAALYLGLSISNLTSMFNPQCVIVGGSLIDHGGKLLTDLIIDSVRAHGSADTLDAVEIRPWSLGRYSGALGAARLVLDQKRTLATAVMPTEDKTGPA